jgi:hypothetical protein
VAGSRCSCASPRDAANEGITYLSEDRKGKGLHVDFGLRENLTLMNLRATPRPVLSPAREEQALEAAVQSFGIRTGDLRQRASRCPAATSRSWRWPRCCSRSRAWWCWTSPRAASTSAPSATSISWCSAWRAKARP